MKRRLLWLPWTAAAVLSTIGFVSSLIHDNTKYTAVSGPSPYFVDSFTGGVIGPTESVRVVFALGQDTSKPPASKALVIQPKVKGTLAWENDYTLRFSPEESFAPDTRYQVTISPAVFVSQALPEIPEPFRFEFATRGVLFNVAFDPIKLDEAKNAVISGSIATEKDTPPDKVERLIQSKDVKIAEWTHQDVQHNFTFQPILRDQTEKNVKISWNGSPINSKEKGETALTIPALARFEVSSITQPENNMIQVAFSSPLRANQDMRGFVSLSGGDLRYSAEQNILKIFGGTGFPDGAILTIKDLTDIYGTPLFQEVTYIIAEQWEPPQVRFAGQGVILPSSQGSALAIETRNVSGAIIEAFEIYGENMAQFLQVNNLDGQRELTRVGAPVWTQAFEFDWAESDKNRWIRRGLDLSALARAHPDSMFHLRVTFRKRHVRYECTAQHGDFSNLTFPSDDMTPLSGETGEFSNWDYAEDYYDHPYEWRRYYQDPCHPAFYAPFSGHTITAGRNILVSDIGILVKRAESGTWFAAVSNLKTAQPEEGAELQFLNYQGRTLKSAKTGGDGIVSAQIPGIAPAFLFVKSRAGRGFLKLNDSLTLATSHFDVSGERARDGVKGFIYAERGVWRPGDAVYLTFILSDAKRALPADHPVVFELEDPQGRIVETRAFTESTGGFYSIPVATKENAPTGDWTARVSVGGSVFHKTLKIETIMPNRLKMTLDSGEKKYLDSAAASMTLEAAWLHGAPAPGLKADVSVMFADTAKQFDTHQDYSFRDPSRSVRSEWQKLFDGTLDAQSRAAFAVKIDPGKNVPGKLSARFMTRVFEPSGAFSSEQVTMDFSPYQRYIGVKLPPGDAARNMLLTDTDHTAEIVALDPEGKPISGKVEVEAALYEMHWRWWWEKGGEDGADFTNAMSRTPVMKETVKIVNGKGQWKFRVNYPSWGRYLVIIADKNGGHSASSIAYLDCPGWAGRSSGSPQGAAFSLNLSAEKQTYNAGETIAISFPSNRNTVALVSLEKAGEIIKQEWMPCADKTTRYEFQADADMTPNIYVHITLLQQHLQTANDLPIRLYGIIPVAVQDAATRLQPKITAPPVWEPRSRVSFTVKEAQGRSMTYTAVAVDEGLLGLTRYSMPNPHAEFYRKEASFLKSWDGYSAVMSAYSGKLETLLGIGGSDNGGQSGERPKRFEPVVAYFEPRQLAPGEERVETFEIGEYVGAVRIMVVAGATDRNPPAYGVAEQSVQVKSDLMVLGTVPRTLSPNDEAVIPVSVFSYQEGNRTVRVSVSFEGNLQSLPGDSNSADVVFDKPGDKTVEFRAKAGSLPGSARIVIRAASPRLADASNTVNLEVRSTALPVTAAYTQAVAPGAVWNKTVDLPGKPGTNTVSLEFSRIPPLNLENRLGYLIAYPHGCIEQTASGAFPQLFLDKAVPLSGDSLRAVRENVVAGIARIASFQTYNGGFSYWPGSGEAHEWGTAYAGHFLIAARKAGYAVPQTLLKKWADFQRNKAVAWAGTGSQADALTQAYRLYTLALSGNPDIGSMNRLRERANLPETAVWRLAGAYWYAGQRDAARSMIASLSQTVAAYRELAGTFGSALRDKAMILEILSLMGEWNQTRRLLEDIAGTLSSDKWLSTQETAYALIAVLPFLTADNISAELEYTVGTVTRRVSFTEPIMQVSLGALSDKPSIAIKNSSAVQVYARITARGLPEEGSEPAMQSGLTLNVQYYNLSGGQVNPAGVPVGEDMEARVAVSNRSSAEVKEIALVHALPASWEILNARLTGSADSGKINYQDIRDDRIMTYFDLQRGESKSISFRVNKAYSGSYFTPAVHAYAMYDESIRAVIPGRPAE
ncbi:MAG: alpha-2-macroglobulin [Spirochaetaceae bacterium]|nr:alpha-2-macroglobulin [Spirochaetaceae bacterium]